MPIPFFFWSLFRFKTKHPLIIAQIRNSKSNWLDCPDSLSFNPSAFSLGRRIVLKRFPRLRHDYTQIKETSTFTVQTHYGFLTDFAKDSGQESKLITSSLTPIVSRSHWGERSISTSRKEKSDSVLWQSPLYGWRGFGKIAVEWTGKAEITRADILGIRWSMRSCILTHSRI